LSSLAKLTAGALQGAVWGGALFNTADLSGLASGSGVLSSATTFDNTNADSAGNGDLKLDASLELAIASTTLAVGAAVYLYIAYLQEDGTNFEDGAFTSGSQKAYQPGWQPDGVFPPTIRGSAQTLVAGTIRNVPLLRKKFRALLFNNLGVALSSSSSSYVYFDTTNINLNG
jgi:hypothetical protein